MRINRLLYIDDDQEDFEIFSLAFREVYHGAAIERLTDCTDIADFLSAQEFDVIVLDRKLPRISGEECLDLIRHVPGFQEVPVIFYSGFRSSPQLKTPDEQVYSLPKTFSFDELVKKMNVFFNSSPNHLTRVQ